jgi:hypothetical protein
MLFPTKAAYEKYIAEHPEHEFVVSGKKWDNPLDVTFSFALDGPIGWGEAKTVDGVTTVTYEQNELHAMLDAIAPREVWKDAFRRALAKWAEVANIKFREVEDDGTRLTVPGSYGRIRFFANRKYQYGAIAFAYQPGTAHSEGDVHLNAGMGFGFTSPDGTAYGSGYDLFYTVLHESGHACGLKHSEVGGAVMVPYYQSGVNQLTPDDIAGIQSIYGINPDLPPPPPPPTDSEGTAVFIERDDTTKGNWATKYGADGLNGPSLVGTLPEGVTVTPSGHLSWPWAGQTDDIRALGSGANRVAACWYGGAFTVDVRVGEVLRRTALYFLDWDTTGRRTRVEVLDGLSGAVLDSREIDNFGGGSYLVYDLTGHVKFRLTSLAGANAVVSGFFFGPAGAAPVETWVESARVQGPVRGTERFDLVTMQRQS